MLLDRGDVYGGISVPIPGTKTVPDNQEDGGLSARSSNPSIS